MHLLRCLYFVEATHRFELGSTYITSSDNDLADDLSRNNLSSFYSKVPQANKEPARVPVQHYFHHGLASSTHKSYDSALRRFYSFCTKYDVFTPFPVTEKLLCYFAAALASEGLAPQTIKCYLSGVRSMQISLGLPPPRDQSSLPIIKRVLGRPPACAAVLLRRRRLEDGQER